MSTIERPLTSALLLCALVSVAPAVAVGGPDEPRTDIGEIVKAWDARARNARTLRFRWTEPYLLSRWHPHSISPWRPDGVAKGAAEPVVNPRTFEPRLSLVVDGDMIRFEKEDLTLSLTQQLVPQASAWVWTAHDFRKLLKPGAVAYPRGHVSEAIHTTWHPGKDPYVAPLLMIYRPFHPALHTFENFAKRFRIVAGKHDVAGRKCVLLKDEPSPWTEIQFSLYLDPQRDFLPMRLAWTAKRGPAGRIDFLDYDKTDENWVLVRWKSTVAVGSVNGPLVSEVALNTPVDTSEFKLEFPPGTWVSELESPTNYIVREAGARRVITENEAFSGATYDDFLTTETGSLAPGPDTTNDAAARLVALAKHRLRQLTELTDQAIWSISIIREGDIEVRVEPVGVVVDPSEFVRIAIDDKSCDAMLFGKGRNEAAARNELAARLRRKIEAADQKHGLTGEQKRKLEFAGDEEITRLFGQAEKLRPQIKRAYDKDAVMKGQLDPSVKKLWQETQPLRRAVDSSAFEDGSPFAKTLKAILTPAQAAAKSDPSTTRTDAKGKAAP